MKKTIKNYKLVLDFFDENYKESVFVIHGNSNEIKKEFSKKIKSDPKIKKESKILLEGLERGIRNTSKEISDYGNELSSYRLSKTSWEEDRYMSKFDLILKCNAIRRK